MWEVRGAGARPLCVCTGEAQERVRDHCLVIGVHSHVERLGGWVGWKNVGWGVQRAREEKVRLLSFYTSQRAVCDLDFLGVVDDDGGPAEVLFAQVTLVLRGQVDPPVHLWLITGLHDGAGANERWGDGDADGENGFNLVLEALGQFRVFQDFDGFRVGDARKLPSRTYCQHTNSLPSRRTYARTHPK